MNFINSISKIVLFMKLLELFSGTGSVGAVAKKLQWDVTSLDLKNADINCDILEWDYKQMPSGHFGMIWSSPPCAEYSIAKTTGRRKIAEANKIVLKTLEIIDYFKPRVWCIENPQTGLLKRQLFMKDLLFVDLGFCKYGMPYRKRTRLWNSLINWKPRPLCKKDCNSMDGSHHKETAKGSLNSNSVGVETAQRAPSGKKEKWKENYTLFKQSDLYKIPTELVEEILGLVGVNFM